MVIIDLFSGAGGLTEGFVREGFEVAVHIEKDRWACETLKTRVCYDFLKQVGDLGVYHTYLNSSCDWRKLNSDRDIIFDKYPELKQRLDREVLNKAFGDPSEDSRCTSTSDIIKLMDNAIIKGGYQSPSLIIGGPPCQVYSYIGRGRLKDAAKNDGRNFLFFYYKNIVENYKPDAFIFENVPGILTARGGMVFPLLQEEFDKSGYCLLSGSDLRHDANIIDASDFGVPQTRKRMILFGFKKSLNYKYPNFKDYQTLDAKTKITTREAIGDLPVLQPSEGHDLRVHEYDISASLSEYQKMMRNDSIGVINHYARSHRAMDREIYALAIRSASEGTQLNYRDLPERLKTHLNQEGFNDRFKVHWWDDVPHTIVAHISKDGHYNIHPDIQQCRSLTVREAARIQSFPDNYRFEGPRTSQYLQVGNAVPPILAQVIARAVKKECYTNTTRKVVSL